MSTTSRLLGLAFFVTALAPTLATAQFTYEPPGVLVSGSGRGREDTTAWVPTMRFPIRDAPAFANSQVYGAGGSMGPSGGQCATSNYSYPWHDNYCESRSWAMPLCPASRGHQGQDIRPSTCTRGVHPAVATVDGTITSIGGYSVYLTAADGTRFDYLHMSNVVVSRGQRVRCGDILGNVSNVFGSTPTTTHLHFNIRQAVRGLGSVYVPTYMSLVGAYERLLSGEMMCGAPVDAGRRDASMPARDAATAPRDASTSRDAFVARDAYTPRDAGGGCRSSILGRTVSNGECVQVGPERRECGTDGCAWYQCSAGAWSCATPDTCPGTQHPNAACAGSGASCHSFTLSADVSHGGCVQVAYAGCGLPACAWYSCRDGAWACSDRQACDGDSFPHADCTDCGSATQPCERRSECCTFFDCEPRTWGQPARECCLQANLECTQDSDCCGTMDCVGGRCECHVAGEECAGDLDCCGALWCTDGVCGTV